MSDQPAGEVDFTAGIDTTVPHSARFWNYLLGGKDNYDVDRIIGDQVSSQFPRMVAVARQSRAFLGRAVRHLVNNEGIDQFLDIGTGLPTAENTHEVAQRHNPQTRVVYVDNDPLVLAHARALLTSPQAGTTHYIHADVRDPDTILHEAGRVLDITQPVGLVLMGILGHIADFDEVRRIVARLLNGLPAGSALIYYDGTNTHQEMVQANRHYANSGAVPYQVRSPEQLRTVFDGLNLIEPGVVPVTLWRPEGPNAGSDIDAYGGVGHIPA